ncbi:MAG: DUF423 domain-containing protein [Geminicoccaceae bacterium]|nr:DUF423 domain-containing protein [Geminicoccaceae bacterium]
MRDGRIGRWLAVAAALLGATAVAMGAFAAHGLRAAGDPRAVELVEIASRYQLAHALAALLAGALRPARIAARLAFVAGALLFPGSLYALAFGLPRGLAMLAPVGGGLFVLGWLLLALDLARGEPRGGAGSLEHP